MKLRVRDTWMLWTIFIIFSVILKQSKAQEDFQDFLSFGMKGAKGIAMTPKAYSKRFLQIRKEHQLFMKSFIDKDYKRSYQLLEIAFGKFLMMMKQINETFVRLNYSSKSDFPTDPNIQEPLFLLMENTCFAGELMLYFPDMCKQILKKNTRWRNTFTWAIEFTSQFPPIIKNQSLKMLDIFRQEINESERSENFKNPYAEAVEKIAKAKRDKERKEKEKKKKKKIKKGPRLVGRDEF